MSMKLKQARKLIRAHEKREKKKLQKFLANREYLSRTGIALRGYIAGLRGIALVQWANDERNAIDPSNETKLTLLSLNIAMGYAHK